MVMVAKYPSYRPKPKRVLMVTEALARGGAERQMVATVHGLLERGYEIEIFELIGVVEGQSSFENEIELLGIRLIRASEFKFVTLVPKLGIETTMLDPFASVLPRNLTTLCSTLALQIEAFCPAVVHCWSDVANLIGGAVATMMDVPRIVMDQNTLPAPYREDVGRADQLRDAYRLIIDHPSIVFVSNSKTCARAYEDWLSLPRNKTQLVYNGFLPNSVKIRDQNQVADCRTQLGLPLGVPVVGAVMRFHSAKDPDLWVRSAAQIAAVQPDIHFVLAGYGHGDIANQLFHKCEQLGLADRLVMPGVVFDVGQIYGALDVLLLTSKYENVPNVMVEAQAAGVPVVGPDVGGIAEAMLDGVTGVVVSGRSAEAFAGAVLRILRDPEWRRLAAAEGPRFVARRFNHEQMVRRMLAAYGDTDSDAVANVALARA